MLSDIILSIIPIFIIRKLNRPFRERVVICILMGLGFLCAACGIPKLIDLEGFGKSPDITWDIWHPTFWIQMEVYIGVSVGCIPPLKSLFERFLKKFGFLTNEEISRSTQDHYQQNWDPSGHLGSNVEEGDTRILSEVDTYKSQENPS
jgi:hypothetical protein